MPTDAGWATVVDAAPVHVATVRDLVIDRLSPEQLAQLSDICGTILSGLPSDRRRSAQRSRHD